jgi:hypothetical protein
MPRPWRRVIAVEVGQAYQPEICELAAAQSARKWYTCPMSSLLEQVVEDLRSLSREDQDRAAEVLLAFLGGSQAKLLEEAVQKLSQLPKGRQDELAQMLIDVAASDLSPYQLTAEEVQQIEEAMAQADRGELASDEEVATMWKRFGL